MEEATEGELQSILRQIIQVLENVLGRTSHWNGKASLEDGLFFAGAARYDGSIAISEPVFADIDLRWRTLIHEALHTFSPRYTHMTYLGAIGWEEGVVEQMQRLLRPAVIAALQVEVSGAVIDAVEEVHPYNKYIAVLEDIRLRLGEEQFRFYDTLLVTPLPDRATLIRQSGILLSGQNRQEFGAALLKAVWALSR